MTDSELIKVLTGFKDEIKNEISNSRDEMASFKDEIKTEMADFKAEMKSEMVSFKTEIKAEMADFKAEMKSEMASFKDEIRTEMADFKAEINAKVDAINERLTNLEGICAVMQYELNKKMDTVLDYIKQDIQKHEEFENHFNYVDSKLVDHSVRLSIIESTKAYKSAVDLMKKNKNLGNTALS